MIAIVDYGMGNLRSVQKALERVGADARITHESGDIAQADKVVLPGVGAMAPAMAKLNQLGLTQALRQAIDAGKPFLGICLGLQLLFEHSTEGGNVEGLKVLKGRVERFNKGKVPHMGWNQVQAQPAGQAMYRGLKDRADMYFCHSYYVVPQDVKIAASITEYGVSYVSSVVVNNIWGVQFHPEKSQTVGLTVLKNFAEIK